MEWILLLIYNCSCQSFEAFKECSQCTNSKCYHRHPNVQICIESIVHKIVIGGASGIMVIVVGNEHGDSSSNPGQD